LKLTLYTGPQCELCDRALEVIGHVDPMLTKLTQVNIRNDVNLYHLYAVRIPVLKREDTQAELGWPFDVTMLETFLR
jgi:hypothetical protein